MAKSKKEIEPELVEHPNPGESEEFHQPKAVQRHAVPNGPDGVIRIETRDVKLLYDSEQRAFCAYPLSPNAKSLFALKKIKKGAPLQIAPESDVLARIVELQRKTTYLADMFLED